MNSTSRLALFAVLLFLALVAFDTLVTRHAIAATPPPPEQYLVVSVARGESDAQLQDQLNNLSTDGWRLRCSLPNGVIMAR